MTIIKWSNRLETFDKLHAAVLANVNKITPNTQISNNNLFSFYYLQTQMLSLLGTQIQFRSKLNFICRIS